MKQPDLFLSTMCFGGASSIAEMLDSANPGLSGGEQFAFDDRAVDSEIPNPIAKFLADEELRKALEPAEGIRDMGWDDVIAADVRKADAPLPKTGTLAKRLGVVRTERQVHVDQVWNVAFNAEGEEVSALLVRE